MNGEFLLSRVRKFWELLISYRETKKEKKENKKQVEKDPWSKFRTRNLRYESLENGIALDWRCVNHWISIMGTVNF